MKTQEVKIVDEIYSRELSAIAPSKAEQIQQTFEPMVKMLRSLEDSFNQIIAQSEIEVTQGLIDQSKKVRREIAQVRIETEAARKAAKEESLREGKAIDGVSNILKWAIIDKEEKLKAVEDTFERLKREEEKQLQDKRVEELSPYLEDAHERNLSSMPEDVWEAFLQTKKRDFEDRIAAEREAEKERERKRIEEEKRLKAIEAENKRYKAEVEAVEAARKIEQENYRKAAEKTRLEAEKKEAENKRVIEAEREKARKLQEEIDDKERKEKQAQAEREEQERKRLQQQEADQEAERKKGDKDKLLDLISDLDAIKTKYSFKSKQNQEDFARISLNIEKMITLLKQR